MLSRKIFIGFCLALALASVQGADYKFIERRSTPGNDISCGQKDSDGKPQPFCRICGYIGGLVDACDKNPECKGFDMEGGYCGYLKGAAGSGKTVYMEGFSHFCKQGVGNSCEGDYIIKDRADIQGHDVDCNAKNYKGERLSYCLVSAYPVEAAAACNANPDCKAFVFKGSYSGYLKTTAGPTTYTEGSTVFVKA